ncbi:uncharacterized protein LOC100852586 isoform X1 [Vitis vinifera]|nr:uncharacterized protein LOC100852586 isoform X1 [Vitis vinifera]XP_019072834.1 uncharacterized protein LOC100852586 isoform X1 [Vitis vinifera]XP_059591072.1 uncharacterized protein LOC100852586 isoform X1 [Vitis vinifera]XP_059591073.1 uncharacterized protein LOC100852586 isoform X1 [Vitis vinifera]XP_059591074.1 uncharacterized protein LOC100852586 isoform X1 [Vitis vinifera]XP_059591075.1 uncharacterized protein LOC100852586 isoform X1 [Vitis vinifera]XP_059591077.1 uncharacterized prot|eukprot:XP_003634702.2 PREDICTED: uncharacterized protein LOC100852586 [Vitis vinifera]
MDSRQRKRRSHVPTRSGPVKLPKSRCSGKKFLSIIDTLSVEKKNVISGMGFGGLMQLGCRELRYDLLTWIVANYDIGYHRVCMQTNVAVPITPQDVREVLGIPDQGVDIVIHNRRATPNCTYNIKVLEDKLHDLPIGDEFMKCFLIFACATILAPNSKQEGMHDLWDTIWDSDVGVRINWAKFLLQYLEDGIRDYRNTHPTYIRGCLLFLQLFYMTKFYLMSFKVEVRSPLCAAWTDEHIKCRLAAEIQTYGNYGHVQVLEQSNPHVRNDARPCEAGSSHSDDPTETIEARLIRNLEHLISLASSVAQDIATLRSRSSGGQRGCALTPPDEAVNVDINKEEGSTNVHPFSDQLMGKGSGSATTRSGQQRATNAAADDGPSTEQEPCPPSTEGAEFHSPKGVQIGVEEGHGSKLVKSTPRRRFKHTTKRLVKPAAICPFVSQCVRQFPKISHEERMVADYALSEGGDPSEILCHMHGTYITRDELSSLNGGRWVNSMIIGVVCRMLNVEQERPPRAHYFDPSFSVVLASLTTKAKKHEIRDRCRMFLDAEYVGHDFSSCELLFFPVCDNNHWHVHVLNIPSSRVEILSSLPLRRGNGISVVSRRLSETIGKAFHAHGMLRRVEVSKFEHVQPQLVQQQNGFDCGMFAIKYMQHWNGATLAQAIAEDKMHLYRLRLVVTLVMNPANNARDTVMKACRL